MNIRRHDESVQPNDVIKAVAVSDDYLEVIKSFRVHIMAALPCILGCLPYKNKFF
jgi:hypothetical protein